MSYAPFLLKAQQKLARFRENYIDAQIKAESGIEGKFRKLGLGVGKKRFELSYYSQAQIAYYQTLSQYRKKIIQRIRKQSGSASTQIQTIARLTIFEEIKKIQEIKERKVRSRGLSGVIRTQVQLWRELNPSLKIWSALVLFIFSGNLYLATNIFQLFSSLTWILPAALACALIIFTEGFQQWGTIKNSRRKKIDRSSAYQRARQKLPSTTKNLASKLETIHQKLETEIQTIRIHEKRTEYRRYLIAALAGGLFVFTYYYLEGIKTAFYGILATLFARLAWFGLPFNSIRQGFSDAFGLKTAEALGKSKKSVEESATPKVPDNPTNVEETKALINEVSQKTGTPAEILWGMLKQESNLGKNIGSGHYKVDMQPAQRKTFEQICQNLNLDPASIKVSRRPQKYGGWGGAMGPAQFIPTTWKLYDQKIADLYNIEYANPWNLRHALTAMGLKLAEDGADNPQTQTEAIGRYFAGGNWRTGVAQRYVNGVLAKSQDF